MAPHGICCEDCLSPQARSLTSVALVNHEMAVGICHKEWVSCYLQLMAAPVPYIMEMTWICPWHMDLSLAHGLVKAGHNTCSRGGNCLGMKQQSGGNGCVIVSWKYVIKSVDSGYKYFKCISVPSAAMLDAVLPNFAFLSFSLTLNNILNLPISNDIPGSNK